MKPIYKHFLLVPALFLLAQALHAQATLLTSAVLTEAGVSKETADSLSEAMVAAWAAYVGDAGLLNPDTRKVDNVSIDAFKSHFSFNAKVFNDLVDDPMPIHYSDYASLVFRRLANEGVRCRFGEASLTRLSYDAAGFYRAEVKAIKRVSGSISTSGRTDLAKERCFDLLYKFEIPVEKYHQAAILSVGGTPCPPEKGEPKRRAVSLAGLGQVAFPFFGFKVADERLDTAAIDISGGPSWAGGLYLRVGLAPGGKVDMGIGLMVSNLEVKAEAMDLKLVKNGTATRLDSLVETMRLSYWDLPLGLHYRLVDDEKFLLSADVFATTHIRWNSYYDRRYYKISTDPDRTIEANIADADYWTYFSLGLGLSARYFFTENFGVELGACFSAGITPLFGHELRKDFFLDEPANISRVDMKFQEAYFEKIRVNAFGLRLGLVYGFNKN